MAGWNVLQIHGVPPRNATHRVDERGGTPLAWNIRAPGSVGSGSNPVRGCRFASPPLKSLSLFCFFCRSCGHTGRTPPRCHLGLRAARPRDSSGPPLARACSSRCRSRALCSFTRVSGVQGEGALGSTSSMSSCAGRRDGADWSHGALRPGKASPGGAPSHLVRRRAAAEAVGAPGCPWRRSICTQRRCPPRQP